MFGLPPVLVSSVVTLAGRMEWNLGSYPSIERSLFFDVDFVVSLLRMKLLALLKVSRISVAARTIAKLVIAFFTGWN